MRVERFLAMSAGVLLLVGCAGPSPYVTPVEEREVNGSIARPNPGTVVPVAPSSEVNVAPIYDVPSFAPTQPVAPKQTPASGSATTQKSAVSMPSNTAVASLLAEARQAADRGDLSGAESQVERALRISPRDPQVFLQLAEIKRRQMDLLQAEQVALRGVAVSSGLPDFQRRLWQELALIREQSGDAAGAAAARAESVR